MTALARKVRRVVSAAPRDFVVLLHPAESTMPASIEVREKGRRSGPRVTISQLHTILAMRAAGLSARGRRARRIA